MQLSSGEIPKSAADLGTFVCQNCRFPCAVCGVAKSKHDFPDAMWKHRHDTYTRTLCLLCSRPKCTSAQCSTCSVCRDPMCKKRKCTGTVQSLHHKLLPQTKEDVDNYLCEGCRYITCKCGRQLRSAKARATARQSKVIWVCPDCHNIGVFVSFCSDTDHVSTSC